jgi:hypothetical protein
VRERVAGIRPGEAVDHPCVESSRRFRCDDHSIDRLDLPQYHAPHVQAVSAKAQYPSNSRYFGTNLIRN